MTYGERLKNARKASRLTQAQLAEKCGFATVTIQQYERNLRQPSLEKLALIAKALNTTVYEMIGDDWSGIDVSDAWGQPSGQKENPAPANGDEEKRRAEYITRFDRAPAWLQDQVLALLEAAESNRAAPGDDPKE